MCRGYIFLRLNKEYIYGVKNVTEILVFSESSLYKEEHDSKLEWEIFNDKFVTDSSRTNQWKESIIPFSIESTFCRVIYHRVCLSNLSFGVFQGCHLVVLKMQVLFIGILVILLFNTCDSLKYPEYFLSKYCEPESPSSQIFMGVTPYYENSKKKLTTDSSSMAIVKGSSAKDECHVVTNCSVEFIPPAGQALLVSPISVDNGNNIGSLSIFIDHQLKWYWDDSHEFNATAGNDLTQVSRVNGNVKFTVTVDKITTTWKHFSLDVLLTAFISESLNLSLSANYSMITVKKMSLDVKMAIIAKRLEGAFFISEVEGQEESTRH